MNPDFGFASLRRILFIACSLSLVLELTAPEAADPKLWYPEPAKESIQALPIGEGPLGAMILGGVTDERIPFGANTLGCSKPHEDHTPSGEPWTSIRQLLVEEKSQDEARLAMQKFLSQRVAQTAYQCFGNLRFHFIGHENAVDYRRELNLDSRVARINYRVDEVSYRREAFVSLPDQAILIRLTADHRGWLSFTLEMDSGPSNSQARVIAPDTLASTGQFEKDGVRFESRVNLAAPGGRTTIKGRTLSVENADSATVILCTATSFNHSYNLSEDPGIACARQLDRLKQRKYESILAGYLSAHRQTLRTAE